MGGGGEGGNEFVQWRSREDFAYILASYLHCLKFITRLHSFLVIFFSLPIDGSAVPLILVKILHE